MPRPHPARKGGGLVEGIALLVALGSAGCPREGVPPSPVQSRDPAPLPAPRPAHFDLRAFGAKGDASTDDGPALQRALQAMVAAGGGTLQVPAGRYVLQTPVRADFTGSDAGVRIVGVASATPAPSPDADPTRLSHGLDLVSELLPRTGADRDALTIRGARSVSLRDLAFVGTPGVASDALVTLSLVDVGEARVTHCEFYGLGTLGGGAIVLARRSGLVIEGSAFLGSTANSAVNASVVDNVEWKAITVAGSVFIDYGQRPELYSKVPSAPPFAWIGIGNAASPSHDSPRREAVIRDVFLDEGGFIGIASTPGRQGSTGAPIDLVYISGLRMNVSSLRSSGNHLDELEGVLVEDSRYARSRNTGAAIDLLRIGEAIVSCVSCAPGMRCVRASPATRRLHWIGSGGQVIDSQAQQTDTIRGTGVNVDPVLQVRREFARVVGRDPDPAAHFYWSRRILRCRGDADCVAARHRDLAAYLAARPQPRFAIRGVVRSAAGSPLPGVTVTLSGSQRVATVTRPDGSFRFRGLPTSGVYRVAAAPPGYPASALTLATPSGNRLVELTVDRRRPFGWIGSLGSPVPRSSSPPVR